MKAWIVAVGSEMLTPFRVDTNSLVITERLNAIGCDVRLKVVVGDSVDELARVLTAARDSVDLIVCTGGLARPKTTSRETLSRGCSRRPSRSTTPSSNTFARGLRGAA